MTSRKTKQFNKILVISPRADIYFGHQSADGAVNPKGRATAMVCNATDILLRPVREPEDMLLLQHIYATSRDYETPYWGFEEPFLTRFLTDQFLIQHRQYRQFPDAGRFIVENTAREPLGRFYLNEAGAGEIRVMDIALLPAHRRCGIGRVLLTRIMERAEREGKQVTLHVEKFNPARLFYERLGFGVSEVGDVYDSMVWPAEGV